MTVVDTRSTAAELPGGWSSFVLGQVGSTELKVLRMDGRVLEAESHDAAEALMVMDGALHLMAGGIEVEVRAGEMYIVAAGVEHAVLPGSRGTLVIIEHSSNAP
ncbi:cupin domain-containing protein [Streptomyces sp. NBC_01077]|uniref:cupin domain-containing protein n=1 Tax=Streptomyces sp. NBC_01077 TaxID=2903746 RepID=UPI003870BD7C|nr:cupin domain-containing protein [Streptomyces sp. NBC_01077]